jgi:tetratricopeptide (TPR) repeat protein
MPPRNLFDPNPPPARRSNLARAKELVEIGDRSFRGNNIHRAEEKYNLAAKADPTAPAPHVHLAQVSLARGDYAAAADHLRDAVTVAPNAEWLLNAPDIQSVFAEPADFAKQLARLESHLQANPSDRDAWFVLGAEWYLSGRSRQASDVFQRLNDRKPDEALATFMDASKTKPPAAAN